MFHPLVLSPQAARAHVAAAGAARRRRTCGPASAEEMSNHFDQLLEQVLRTARIGEFAAGPRSRLELDSPSR